MIVLPYHNYYPHQWEFAQECIFGDRKFAYLRWCRRAGKDDCMINGLSIKVMDRVGLYVYLLPYYEQVRKIIWENIGEDGKRFIDYFPDEIVEKRRNNDMAIFFKNGSILKFAGSDNYASLRGWNPVGIVQAEYQDHKAEANADLLPIILRNNGFMWKNGVHPETRNHAFDLWQSIQNDKEWFISSVNWHDVKDDKLEFIYTDRAKSLARVQMKPHEIDTNFEMRLPQQSERYIYLEGMNLVRNNDQIKDFHLENRYLVNTYWDLGVSNVYSSMAVWLIQDFTDHYRAIGYFEGCGKGILDYMAEIKEFCTKHGLRLGRNITPHDSLTPKDYLSGKNLIQSAAEQGVKLECPIGMKAIKSGIQNVKDVLPRIFFHKTYCAVGVKCLDNYERHYNKELNVYGEPIHNQYSHGADAFRYFAQLKSIENPRLGETVIDLMNKRYNNAQEEETVKFKRYLSG